MESCIRMVDQTHWPLGLGPYNQICIYDADAAPGARFAFSLFTRNERLVFRTVSGYGFSLSFAASGNVGYETVDIEIRNVLCNFLCNSSLRRAAEALFTIG